MDHRLSKEEYVNNVNRTKHPDKTSVKCRYHVNSLRCLLIFMLISFASCDQRTYVQLQFETEENLPVNSLIGQIKVPDSYNFTQPSFLNTEKSILPYLILPVNAQQKGICNLESDLNIDQHTGQITNAISLDREKCSLYKFLAISLKGLSFQITIKVLDKNDNSPFFSIPSISIQLPENSKPNEIKRQLPRAQDLDSELYSLQTYRIKSGNVKNAFKLLVHRENDGILYLDLQVNNELDREEISNYKLIIEALDGGQPPLSAELEVNIEILDVNDHAPQFDKQIYNVKLQQNTTVGSRILQVQATDKDINSNAQIIYSLQESPKTLKLLNKNQLSNHLFKIDNNGWIVLVSPLNLPKSLTNFELIVYARDNGDTPLETNALVIISIQHTNNFNLPKINIQLLNENNQPELNESTKVGEIVARVSITDGEEENESSSKLTSYALLLEQLNSSSTKFVLNKIDQNTYLVKVNDKLDLEQQEYFNLKFTAYQLNKLSSPNATQLLQLKLIDSNNNRPYFENKINRIRLNQHLEIGTVVYQFKALDKDLPATNQLNYKLDKIKSDRQSLDWFELNKMTGELKTKQLIDCNLNKNPLVVVNVNDGVNEGEETSLVIELQSNNNYVPVFEQTFYNVTIEESASIGVCFLNVHAIDLDCGLNSTIEYSLVATNRADLPLTNDLSSFQLNKTTGELCLKSKLDYEQRQFYELIVIAYNPIDRLNSTSIVHIYVLDSNDFSPKFLTNYYKVNLHENIIPLTSNGLPAPILIVKAYDEDLTSEYNKILYSITNGNDEFCFEIDEQTGKLYLLKPLSSVKSVYQLTISAEDLSGLKNANTATVQVNVLHSGSQQYLHFNNTIYNFNLVENALPGTKIGKLSVQTTSTPILNHVNMYKGNQQSSHQQPSNHLLEYEIYSGNDNQLFQLDPNTGDLILSRNASQLSSNALLDYEKVQSLLLNVQCRLIGANNEYIYAFSQVNVSIVNLNDINCEFYNDLSVLSLKENLQQSNRPLLAVKAIDQDASLFGRIKYHFRSLVQDNYETSDQAGPFQLNKHTGEIFLNGNNSELDFEQKSSYDLNLLCIDGGGRTNEMQLKINLIDQSDNQPYFVDNLTKQPIHQFNLSVYENLEPNTTIHQFASLDQDVNDKTFIYSIINEKQVLVNQSVIESNRSDCFRVGLTNGNLKVNCVLDAEKVINYELKLEVKDSGDNRGHLTLFIDILDLNDNYPQFNKNEYRFELSEDSLVGTRIGQLSGFDLDRGSNATVQFELVKSFDEFFELNKATGELFLQKKIDRECDKDRFILKVKIFDLGEKVSLVNEQPAVVVIDILNVNDKKPAFLDENTSISQFIKAQCSRKHQANRNGNLKIEQFKIASNSPVSTIVTKIRAYDMDSDKINYAIKFVQELHHNQFVETKPDQQFSINSDGLIQTASVFDNRNQTYRLAVQIEDSKGLTADHLKWIEIRVISNENIKKDMQIRKLSGVEYIEVDGDLESGTAVGKAFDLRTLKPNQTANCDNFYLNGEFDDLQLPFILNIDQTKVNLVSLTKFNESKRFRGVEIHLRAEDCSLSLTSSAFSSELHRKGYVKLLSFEIEIKRKENRELPFDCLRKQLKNAEFGDELIQVNLDLNQEIRFLKSIDLFDFKRCSSIQPNQQFKLISIDKSSTKLFNQLKLNSDLVLQLWSEESDLPYDKELLIQVQAPVSNSDYQDGLSSDSILMNFVFNKLNDLNLNNVKVVSKDQLEFEENCCLKNENIHHVLLNYDLNDNYDLKFRFINNNQTTYDIFRIDNNGLISLTNEFDYENQSIYNLDILIEINELSSNFRTKSIKQLEHSIKISIEDINDETPKFNQQDLNIEFAENTPINTLLIKLKAIDRDLVDSDLIYFILDGYQYKKTFELSKTGELRLKSSLDREKVSSYKIPVIVFDNDYQHNDQAFVVLNVIDINNNRPQFKQQNTSLQIPENLPINTLIYTFIAFDEDESSHLIYELVGCMDCKYDQQPKSSTCNNLFKLDTKTGKLFTNDIVDFEVCPFYNLTVSVTDGQHSSNTNLILNIKNLNDNQPTFEKQVYETIIDLDSIDGKEFIELLKLKASDLDKNAKQFYSINLESNDGVYFTLNSTTGQLSIHHEVLNQLLKSKLNRSIKSIKSTGSISAELEVQVIDPTSYNVLTSTTTIRIQFNGKSIENLSNELNELRKERTKFSQYPLVIELNEQSLSRKIVSNDKNVRFKLVNQTNDFRQQFSLSEVGELSLKQQAPQNKNYECFVLAIGENGDETMNLIQFNRQPLPQTDKQLRKFSFDLNLEENTEIGYRLIQLEERVNIYLRNEHRFKMIYSSVDSSWFDLDSKTGLLKTAIKFDYEKHPSKIELIILASLPDSYSNLMFFNLTINLININEYSPIFNHPIIYTTINESLPKDTFVVRLSSIDLDTIDSNRSRLDAGTTYHIVEGDRDNAFYIKDNRIYTNVVLDREICEKYTLSIYTNDQSLTTKQRSITNNKLKSNSIKYLIVEILIIDQNDNYPQLIGRKRPNDNLSVANQEFTITENVPSESIGHLNSNDVDLYPMLTYQIVDNQANSNLFDLNQFNGEIRLKNKIKYEEPKINGFIDYDSALKEFYLNVTASDSKHLAETRIKISLKRPNIYQQMPTFERDIYYHELDNNKDCLNRLNCILFQVKSLPFKRAIYSPKIKVQYKLIGKANRYFFIDQNDGFIYNNQSLSDLNKNRLFRLIVQSYYAFDNGRPINNLKSTATLLIVVRKEEQMKGSSFISSSFNQTIELQKYQYGDVIYRLPLTDFTHSSINYELTDSTFALRNRNQLIILRKPKRIENALKIKRILDHNQTDFVELSIRNLLLETNNQLFKSKLFNIQVNEDTLVGRKLADLKGTEKTSKNFTIYKGNELNHFRIDQTGCLYLAKMLNCKTKDHFNLVVLGCDDVRCSFAIVKIQIADFDHLTLPVLPLSSYRTVIKENTLIGTKILRITKDAVVSDAYKYVLTQDKQDNQLKLPFEFDSKTGYLVTRSIVDYEQLFFKNEQDNTLDLKLGIQLLNSNYNLKPFHNSSSNLIKLDQNRSFNSLLNQVTIKIKINSEDEFYPKFDKNVYDFKLEIQPNETNQNLVVGQVQSEDLDSGVDGKIIYSINATKPNWMKELFSLNEQTGILTLNLQSNNAINNLLQTSLHSSIIVNAKSPRPNSLSSTAVINLTMHLVQTKLANQKSNQKLSHLDQPNRNSDSFVRSNNKLLNSLNKNVPLAYEPNELNQLKSTNKQTIRNFNQENNNNFSLNSQRNLNITNNLIQVYGIVIGLLALLLILILLSVVLMFRICNFNRKRSSTSSNNSIYNSKNQDFDPNCQLTKSLSCLIDRNYNSNYNINYGSNYQQPKQTMDSTILTSKQQQAQQQHNKLKQTDFIVNNIELRNSIIYQEQQNQYLGSNSLVTNLANQNDAASSCNTSTIMHSNQNSDCSTRLTKLSSNQLTKQKNFIKNRPLPAIANKQPDLVNSYQELNYDEAENNVSYYSNYRCLNDLDSSYNHNYEAIAPTYDQVDVMQNWTPVYCPVTEVIFNQLPTKQFASESRNDPIKTAMIANTNKLN